MYGFCAWHKYQNPLMTKSRYVANPQRIKKKKICSDDTRVIFLQLFLYWVLLFLFLYFSCMLLLIIYGVGHKKHFVGLSSFCAIRYNNNDFLKNFWGFPAAASLVGQSNCNSWLFKWLNIFKCLSEFRVYDY